MNILIVKGSPKNRESNTDRMANALAVTLDDIGDTYTVIDLNKKVFSGCSACNYCIKNTGKCVKSDDLTSIMQDIYSNTYDTIFLVFPIYNFGINSLMQKFLERRYAYPSSQKIGAVVLHGSKDELNSGVDIVDETLYRNCRYCGDTYLGMIDKCTDDKLQSVTREDMFNLRKLVKEV